MQHLSSPTAHCAGKKLLSGRVIEQPAQRSDPCLSVLLDGTGQWLQVQSDYVFMLHQGLLCHLIADPDIELKLLIIHHTRGLLGCKLLHDNSLVEFPERAIAHPGFEVGTDSIKETLHCLGDGCGLLIYLWKLAYFTVKSEDEWFVLTIHMLWRALDATAMHPANKQLKSDKQGKKVTWVTKYLHCTKSVLHTVCENICFLIAQQSMECCRDDALL